MTIRYLFHRYPRVVKGGCSQAQTMNADLEYWWRNLPASDLVC